MRFSIVIPCLNRHNDLRIALRSCLDQTFTCFEVIVVDDCSEPPLAPICESFGDSRIQCFRNEDNLGVSASRNLGLARARGEYVSFLDSDDHYLPRRLEILDLLAASQAPPPDIVFHRQKRVISAEDAGMVIPRILPSPGQRLDEFILVDGHFLQTNCYAVRTELAQLVTFDVNCSLYEDSKFILECWLSGKGVAATEEVLSIYNDFAPRPRLSRNRSAEQLQPMLSFARTRCSRRAHLGFDAFACGETSFLRHPIRVCTALFRGFRAGTPLARCLVYLARSIFGSAYVDNGINVLRCSIFPRVQSRVL